MATPNPERMIIAYIALVFVVVGSVACGSDDATLPSDDVVFRLQWFHQSQFAGYYAADQRGLYEDEGLKVSLVPIDKPGTDTIQSVVDGSADFGTIPAVDLARARAQGRPVVAIAAVMRRDPLVFMTLSESGLARPQDFPGHTLAVIPGSNGEATFAAMMAMVGLDLDDVETTPTTTDISRLARGEVDIWTGYLTNEVLKHQAAGVELNIVLPSDYGVQLYGDTIYTSERLLRENPELVTRFLRATLRGWEWAVEHPEEAGELSLQYDPSLDSFAQQAQMLAVIPLVHTGEDEIGRMKAAIWTQIVSVAMENSPDVDWPVIDSLFTTSFLDEIYAAER